MILSPAPPVYIGRFAPSPTGPLHLGSLYTAVASYLDARHHGGLWLLRIDDLDTPRNVSGADRQILNCLQRFGLQWDGDVFRQSQHQADYQTLLAKLLAEERLFACRCSRKTLAGHGIYPGHCRTARWPADDNSALRLRCSDSDISFVDGLQGMFTQNVAREHGDYIVRRRDQIVAYQFAVVVDDHLQGVNHVVRGADLLDSTIKQIYLQNIIGYSTPAYSHLPLIVDQDGNKLSKQTLAAPVDDNNPSRTLFLVLQLLRQNPPSSLADADLQTQLNWAIAHWQPQALKKMRAIRPPII